ALVSIEASGVETLLVEQLVEQSAGAGVRIAIHETDPRTHQLLQGSDPKRIASLHHEAHLASHESNGPMFAGTQPRTCCGDGFLSQLSLWQMNTGQLTAAVRERYERVLIADVAQVDIDIGVAADQLAQFRHRKPVARVHPDDVRALRQRIVEL